MKNPAVAAIVCAALFVLCSLPALERPGIPDAEGFQAVQALVLHDPSVADRVPGLAGMRDHLPWMSIEYIGALKVYLYAAFYAVFGVQDWVVRGLNVALGALAVAASVLIVAPLGGLACAWGLGLWLACDPALVLYARYDSGPVMLTTAFKLVALALFVSAGARRSAWRLALGGMLFGLCLWDKAHFLWFLAGTGAAAALWLPRETWTDRRVLVPVVGGFIAGAMPFFLYNMVFPLQTFASQPWLKGGAVLGFWQTLPREVPARWRAFLEMMDGEGHYAIVSSAGVSMREGVAWLHLVCWSALAAGLLGWAWRRRHSPVGAAAGLFLTAGALTLAAALASPRLLLHHLPMIYPLPHLAVALFLGAARLPRKALLLAPLLAASIAADAAFLYSFGADVERTGGAAHWYKGYETLTREALEEGGTVVTMNSLFQTPLTLYSHGRLRIVQGEARPEFQSEQSYTQALREPDGFEPGMLVAAYRGPYDMCDPSDALARRFIDWELAKPHPRLRLVAKVPYSDGSPWGELYKVR